MKFADWLFVLTIAAARGPGVLGGVQSGRAAGGDGVL